MVGSAPRKNALKLSDSLFNTPLKFNDPVSTAAQRNFRTKPERKVFAVPISTCRICASKPIRTVPFPDVLHWLGVSKHESNLSARIERRS